MNSHDLIALLPLVLIVGIHWTIKVTRKIRRMQKTNELRKIVTSRKK